jgi:hypothetical protein
LAWQVKIIVSAFERTDAIDKPLLTYVIPFYWRRTGPQGSLAAGERKPLYALKHLGYLIVNERHFLVTHKIRTGCFTFVPLL